MEATRKYIGRCLTLSIVAFACLSPRMLGAQAPNVPAFDVASVKPSRSADTESSSMVAPGGRYVATNITVRQLIRIAYGLHETQVVGGPDWIGTERFDIEGKAPGFATAA